MYLKALSSLNINSRVLSAHQQILDVSVNLWCSKVHLKTCNALSFPQSHYGFLVSFRCLIFKVLLFFQALSLASSSGSCPLRFGVSLDRTFAIIVPYATKVKGFLQFFLKNFSLRLFSLQSIFWHNILYVLKLVHINYFFFYFIYMKIYFKIIFLFVKIELTVFLIYLSVFRILIVLIYMCIYRHWLMQIQRLQNGYQKATNM